MRHKSLDFGFGIMAMVAVIVASGNRESLMSQQSTPSVKSGGTPANRKDSTAKRVQDLTEEISNLKSRINLLEAQQDQLRGRLTQIERPQSTVDLSDAASELARFDCEPDFNRAHAMAISQGTPGYTL